MFSFKSDEGTKKESTFKQGFIPFQAGISKVELIDLALTEENHLDFKFKGTEEGNLGNYDYRVWANAFDPEQWAAPEDAWKAKEAEKIRKHVMHLCHGYLTDSEYEELTGKDYPGGWPEFRIAIMQTVTPDKYKGVESELKIIYKGESDEKKVFPNFPPFINTTKRPNNLKIGTAVKDNGIPWDRIKPMSEYGAIPSAGAPSGGFGASTPAPTTNAFGAPSTAASFPPSDTPDKPKTTFGA